METSKWSSRNSWKPDPFVIVNMFPRLRHSRPKLWSLSPDYFSVVYPVPIACQLAKNAALPHEAGNWLVIWNINFIFPYIGFLIIPIDFHIFQRGFSPTTNQERFSIQPRSRGSAAIQFRSIPSSVAGRLPSRRGQLFSFQTGQSKFSGTLRTESLVTTSNDPHAIRHSLLENHPFI